jgi:hypothetical protein
MKNLSEDVYMQFLRGYVAESAAGTLTEGDSIETGCTITRIQGNSLAMEVHFITSWCGFPEDNPSTGNEEYVTFWISTRTGLAAVPHIDEHHVMYQTGNVLRAGAATYLPLVMVTNQYMPSWVEFTHPLLVSQSKLFPYIKSSNSGSVAACYYMIGYTYVLVTPDIAIEALEAFRNE